jgi:hypothetical protein
VPGHRWKAYDRRCSQSTRVIQGRRMTKAGGPEASARALSTRPSELEGSRVGRCDGSYKRGMQWPIMRQMFSQSINSLP